VRTPSIFDASSTFILAVPPGDRAFSEVRFVRGSSLNNLQVQTGGPSSKVCLGDYQMSVNARTLHVFHNPRATKEPVLCCIEAIAVPQGIFLRAMGKTNNEHKQLHASWCSGSEPNYVKSLSSVSHTFDRPSHKLLIVRGLMPVAEGRRNVTLVTRVTKVIARRAGANPRRATSLRGA